MTRTNEKGQAMYLTALGMLALMGFVGLGIDMGVLRYQKRLLQSAADAGALAAAANLNLPNDTGYANAAQNSLPTNGFKGASTLAQQSACPTSVTGLTVTVNNPPLSGQHTGSGYVEVCVSQLESTFFMKLFGYANATVSARAVAGTGSPGNGCLYTLNPVTPGIYDIDIKGNPTINAPNCGIVDDGNFGTKGNALQVNAYTFGVAGTWDSSGTKPGDVTCAATPGAPCPATGIPPSGDPLYYLKPPSGMPCGTGTGKSCPTSPAWAPGNGPGTYSSMSVSATGTLNLQPGLYIIDGPSGVSMGGGGTITSTGGVTFYFTNGGTINATGNTTFQLSACGDGIACTGGAYPGVLFYQDPTDTNGPSLGGNNRSYFQGAVYFPTATITIFGDAGFTDSSAAYTVIVAGALALHGNPTLDLNPYPSNGGTGDPLLGNPVLVE